MAEIHKVERSAVGRVFLHNLRQKDDGVSHQNKNIDNERTDQNYGFFQGSIVKSNDIHKDEIVQMYKNRLNEVYHLNRKNLVTLMDVVVTLPCDVEYDDEQYFFKSVYDFYLNDFGEKNMISAIVHKDEVTPHIHLDIVPAMPLKDRDASETLLKRVEDYGRQRGIQVVDTLNARDLINRVYLQQMHPRLSDFMEERLGYPCEILNGATKNGNQTVLELKNKSLERMITSRKEEVDRLQKNINTLLMQLREMELDKSYFSSVELINRMHFLTKENEVLREIVESKGLEIPPHKIREIIDLSKSLQPKFVYEMGEIPYTSRNVVVETYKDKPRILPYQAKIEQYPSLVDVINNEALQKLLYVKEDNTTFILFPTDCIEDTIRNLIELSKLELDEIEMPQISNDNYSLAEQILKQSQMNVNYHLLNKEKFGAERDDFTRG